jgi:hypothetical protein
VEPKGPFENDPNLTDRRFPGNPRRSYRTRQPVRVLDEVLDWKGHSPEALQEMRNHLEEHERLGIEGINDCPVSAADPTLTSTDAPTPTPVVRSRRSTCS